MSGKQLTGRLHVHTENSLKNSASRPGDIAKKAKSLGLTAVAITDYGNITGWQEFYNACRKEGIKPIYGVEAYVVEDVNTLPEKADESDRDTLADRSGDRLHLVMLGIDDIGRKAISLMVTESNRRIVLSKDGKCSYPCMDLEMIEQCVGEGAEAHGHVIATSADENGILAGMSIANEKQKKELEVLEPEMERQKKVREICEKKQKEIDDLTARREAAKPVSQKKYAGRKKALKAVKEEGELETALLEIAQEEQETEDAKAFLKESAKTLKALKQDLKAVAGEVMEDGKYFLSGKRLKFLKENTVPAEALALRMKERAEKLVGIFGEGNFYVELQNHGSEPEAAWMPVLYGIARELKIPVMASNDEILAKKEDTRKMEFFSPMKLSSFQYYPQEERQKERYFKTDEELRKCISELISEEAADEAFEGISTIIERCDEGCIISPEKHYPRFDESLSKEETQALLEKKAREGIPGRYGNAWDCEKEERLTYELGIIDSMGFEDYFLIVAWYLEIARNLGTMRDGMLDSLKKKIPGMAYGEIISFIKENQGGIGYAAGPGRGSGAGSIVCYLTGITSIDPLKYGLVFERFLNPERVSMPDIDCDFSKEIRDTLIAIVKKKYGQDGVATIMTKSRMKAKNVIQVCAKVYGTKTKGDSMYFADLAMELSGFVPDVKGNVAAARKAAETKYPGNEDVKNILDAAEGLEGTYDHVGKHAAAVVISDNGDIKQYTALLWDEKESLWKTQMDKDEVERNHLLKMDFLGLKNLDIISRAIRMIKSRRGVVIDPDRLDVNPEVIATFAAADTDEVFQFESDGMKKMLRQFGPDCFEDLILLVAAYRPGPLQFLPDVIKVKNGADPEYLTDALIPILKDTYGQIIYQEQVMQIFQQLAGYSLGGADLVRRAMGHKEAEKLKKERKAFVYGDPERGIKGCINNGIEEEAADKLFSQMEKFAEYAFNKSHAAAYAWISYITAYLKFYYPEEFMAAAIDILGNEDAKKGTKKISGIAKDCRAHGVVLACPDINISGRYAAIEGGKVYLGLQNIKSVSGAAEAIEQERKENGPYTGVSDFLIRTRLGGSSFTALLGAGAFDSFASRSVLLSSASSLQENIKNAGKYQKELEIKQKMLDALDKKDTETAKTLNGGRVPKRANLENRMAELQKKLAVIKEELDANTHYGGTRKDDPYLLRLEKSLLGIYISGDPLGGFVPTARCGKEELADLSPHTGYVDILAFPSDIESKLSKKGSEYVNFTAFTPLGEVRAVCFDPETAGKIKSLEEPAILHGRLKADKRKSSDEDEEEEGTPSATFSVMSVKSAARKKKNICLVCRKEGAFERLEELSTGLTDMQKGYVVTERYDEGTGERVLCILETGYEALKIFKSEGWGYYKLI